MKTQLKINEKKLLSSLKHAFTNSHTVLGELLQNARRSGSPEIHITAEDNYISIRDEGNGIDDINTLLTIAESGWDLNIIEHEHPFGLGFLSALFACERIMVTSKFGTLFAMTADILAMRPLTINTKIVQDKGTTITLEGLHNLNKRDIINHLKRLAFGFPIPVFVNGVLMESPLSKNEGEWLNTDVGLMRLPDRIRSNRFSNHEGMLVFLQGVPIYYTGIWFDYNVEDRVIVHLDSRQFMARLPDRDKLIDQDEVLGKIKKAARAEVRKLMIELKKNETADVFASRYKHLSEWKCLDLLNDLPVLPAQVVLQYTGAPNCSPDYMGGFTCLPETPILRGDVESGAVKVFRAPDKDEYESMTYSMFMFESGHYEICGSLDADHWIYPHIKNVEAMSVESIGDYTSARFHGSWVDVGVRFVDSYKIRINDEIVEVFDKALYADADLVLFPAGCRSHDAQVVSQLCSFLRDNDEFDETQYDLEGDKFATFITVNRSTTPIEMFQAVLNVGRIPDSLFNKQFIVSINEHGTVSVESEIK